MSVITDNKLDTKENFDNLEKNVGKWRGKGEEMLDISEMDTLHLKKAIKSCTSRSTFFYNRSVILANKRDELEAELEKRKQHETTR